MGIKFLPYLISLIFISLSCNKEEQNINVITDRSFIKGADVSFLPEIRSSKIQLYSNGKAEDALTTLKNHEINTIRLRLWKNPSSNTSSLASVQQLSEECKQLGFNRLITLHYSDTWADPGHQTLPLEWKGLSFNELLDSAKAYTKMVVEKLEPEYIQIGNEINNGLLWPHAEKNNESNFIQVIQVLSETVHDTHPEANVLIHYAGIVGSFEFFKALSSINYDYIALSYYPLWHGKNLDATLDSIKVLYNYFKKPILIVETAYPFTFNWNDWTHNIIGSTDQILPEFSASPEGQKAYIQYLLQSLIDIAPQNGICYWGGEWVSYKGDNATDGSSWENQAFWDFNFHSLPVIEAFNEN